MTATGLKLIKSFLIVAFFSSALHAQSHYPGQHPGKFAIADKLQPTVLSFDAGDVRLTDSRFKQNMDREIQWLMSLKINSLLHSFRTNAGLFSGNEGGYMTTKKLAGWESLDCDLRGHTTGHILSALALLHATTAEEKFKIKSDSLVTGLREVQNALDQNGYLSAFPQELINRNINAQRVWAPWYTLHKLFAGLLDQYLYCNNKDALTIASQMGEWAYKKLSPLTPEQRTKMLRNEFGGVNESFYNLYAITANEKFKWLGDFFYHHEMLDPLKEEKDILEGKHANTYIPKLLGLTRNYELQGVGDAGRIASFFWQTVTAHHTFCTGSNSDKEHFFKPDDQSKHLTGYTGESCNVYNMLKLTKHLFSYTAESKYADYYEKALINHILGQQDPATGMISYFLPLLPGAHKVYSTPDSSFWCCVGSGFENQAKYGESIYYHAGNDLYINLFIPSELNWKERSLIVKQETAFPEEGKTRLTVDAATGTRLTFYIRYPSWAVSGATIKINGKRILNNNTPGSYIMINRHWKKGDIVDVDFPMSLRVIPANDTIKKAAIAYGPVVLAGEMGTAGLIKPAPYSNPQLYNDYYTYDYKVPDHIVTTLHLDAARIDDYIEPVPGRKLTFRTKKEGIILKPLYDSHRERYVVYWDIKGE